MLSNRWIELRKTNWTRLEHLVQQVESGSLKSLSGLELHDLGLLYRQAAADLSTVRTDETSHTLEAYLNRLVSRAHNFVYSGRRLGWLSLWHFFAQDYPRLFRRLLPYTVTALIIALAGGLLGTILTQVRPSFMHAVLGPQMLDTIEHHKMWTDAILSAKPQASTGIMTNNISVCFMTFAGGITAGLWTIVLLFFNGLSVGVISTACAQHGMGLQIGSFIAAHGALELPSIFIAGGAGLRLGAGILFPGMLRRRDALALAGSESIRLVAGTIPLLVIAGLLEAFLSPTPAPVALKFSVGAALFTLLTLWLTQAGKVVGAPHLASEMGGSADPQPSR